MTWQGHHFIAPKGRPYKQILDTAHHTDGQGALQSCSNALTHSKGSQRHIHHWGGNVDEDVWQDGRHAQEYDVIEQVPPSPINL